MGSQKTLPMAMTVLAFFPPSLGEPGLIVRVFAVQSCASITHHQPRAPPPSSPPTPPSTPLPTPPTVTSPAPTLVSPRPAVLRHRAGSNRGDAHIGRPPGRPFRASCPTLYRSLLTRSSAPNGRGTQMRPPRVTTRASRWSVCHQWRNTAPRMLWRCAQRVVASSSTLNRPTCIMRMDMDIDIPHEDTRDMIGSGMPKRSPVPKR